VTTPASYPPGIREYAPRMDAFDIGKVERVPTTDSDRTIVILRRNTTIDGNVFGLIRNIGNVAFVFAITTSNDNNVADAWGAQNIRVGGSAVASVTVQPGAYVEFLLEGVTKPYLRLQATEQNLATGRVVLVWWNGTLEREYNEKRP
jgi:hypothetical protein